MNRELTKRVHGDVWNVLIKDMKRCVLDKMMPVNNVSIAEVIKSNVDGQYYWVMMNYQEKIKDQFRDNMVLEY